MRCCKNILFGLYLITTLSSLAQGLLPAFEDTLMQEQKKLYSSGSDQEKLDANFRLKSTFERALSVEHSFDYSFDSLKEIGRIYSPDKAFRIINWDLARNDGTHDYFGFIQVYNIKKKTYLLYFLTDKSADIKNAENAIGDANKWFGMLYYKIIPVKVKGKKYYTLLGFDGNDKLTSKKIIDVLSFNTDGSPRFGADLFKLEKKSPKRVIFEYAAQAVMSLKYNEDTRQIMFDHLSPSEPKLEGQFQYYGPDFSFDALEFKKGKWVYTPDVDARNKSSSKDNRYKDPKDKSKDHTSKQIYKSPE